MPVFRIPELLAPAGSPETFQAGFDAGADAFYLGAPDFNARKRAKNFTQDEIEQAAAFAHQHNKKIYLTLNTLVYDSEIPALLDLLLFIDRIRADAVIVQDLGVLNLIHRHFPSLRIHASTQTFCHNSMQAQFLKDAGVSRIVLPRELSLDEISAIAKKVPLEYELFIHGALCFSFSGCCLFSSYRYNASGNRGECRQLCRHAFETADGTSYPFSMKDLNAAPILGKILETEPAALKIEGRLKNADYVSRTVSMYRKMLDAYAKTGKVKTPETEPKGQRVFTAGYFDGNAAYGSMVTPEAAGVIGERIGVALIHKSGQVNLSLKAPLPKGARIRLADADGRMACEGTLLSFSTRVGKSSVEIIWNLKEAEPARGQLTALLLGTYQPGDPHRAFKHALAHVKTMTLQFSLLWKAGRFSLKAEQADGAELLTYESGLALEPVRNAGGTDVLQARVREMFSETGEFSFAAGIKEVEIPSGMFCPLSQLKKFRREAFAAVQNALQTSRIEKGAQVRGTVLNELKELQHSGPAKGPVFLDSAGLETIPLFVPEAAVDAWRGRIDRWLAHGPARVLSGAYGWLTLFRERRGSEAYSGPYVYCVNSFAARFLCECGATGCVLSPDTDDATLGPVAGSSRMFRMRGKTRELMAFRLRPPETGFRLKGRPCRVEHREDYNLLVEPDPG